MARMLGYIKKKGDFSGLNAPILVEEVKAVLKNWKSETVPGPDGIPYEFFKVFSKDTRLLHVLTIVMTSIYQKDQFDLTMPKEWKEGVIKILHKKGDTTLMANYRPLSMMNSTAKMFTSLLNSRLIHRFVPLIGAHQTGFMPGRNILENVKEAQVLLDVAELRRKPLYLVLLDQEKAYDRVDHTYLWGCLRQFGVPRWMIELIKSYYRDTTSVVSINRNLSDPIQLTRGVRQGCPLSCLLFNIAIEPFALLLIDSPGILPGWINESGIRHIVRMFADDTMVVLTSLGQWRGLLRLYDLYAKASGGSLNVKKTEIVCAGIEGDPGHIQDVKITYKQAVRYLGIPIGVSIDLKEFWDRLLQKIKLRIAEWQKVYLGLEGRIAISKNCLQGMLWYFVRCLPINKHQIAAFSNLIDRYVWARKDSQALEAPIPINQTSRPRVEGGQNTMDIQNMITSLNMYWIQQMDAQLEIPLEHKKSWTIVALEIMLFHAPAHVKKMVNRPWDQWWDNKELTVQQPSVSHFWSRWVLVGRERLLEPDTLEQVLSINFWYHPAFKVHGRNRPRHGTRCWEDMLLGTNLPYPVVTVKDLMRVGMGVVPGTTPTMIRAASQLVQLFPATWKALLGEDLNDAMLSQYRCKERFRQTAVSNKFQGTLPLKADNKSIYTLVKRDLVFEGTTPEGDVKPVKDMLSYLKGICFRDYYKLPVVPEKVIWASARDREIDYPKFSDLYWRLLQGKVRTGEQWMQEKYHCPRCRVPQTVEHLFWNCPIARSLWRMMADTWFRISERHLELPHSWAELLLWGCVGRRTYKRVIDRKRWRALFGVTFWSLWRSRSSWSHDETIYTYVIVHETFRELLTLKIHVARQRCLNLLEQEPLEEQGKIWEYSPIETDTPPWLEELS